MESTKIAKIANELMNAHMPCLVKQGWRFTFNTRLTRAIGRCNYRKKEIELSTKFAPAMNEAEVLDTILHEIAHALTPGDKHGARWKAVARKLGANPSSTGTIENKEAVKITSKYVIVFKNANGEIEKVAESRTLRSLEGSYLKNRKEETLGKLKCIPTVNYERMIKKAA